jgi:hypothetical protein
MTASEIWFSNSRLLSSAPKGLLNRNVAVSTKERRGYSELFFHPDFPFGGCSKGFHRDPTKLFHVHPSPGWIPRVVEFGPAFLQESTLLWALDFFREKLKALFENYPKIEDEKSWNLAGHFRRVVKIYDYLAYEKKAPLVPKDQETCGEVAESYQNHSAC